MTTYQAYHSTTEPVEGKLPDGEWIIMPMGHDFVLMAWNKALGCWIWLDNGWHEAYPESNDVLSYDVEWYRRG